MAKRRRKKKIEKSLIDYSLLAVNIPEALINAEKVADRLQGKKTKPKHKASVQWKAAKRNYAKAITRRKLADTLLEKHFKILSRYVKKYS